MVPCIKVKTNVSNPLKKEEILRDDDLKGKWEVTFIRIVYLFLAFGTGLVQ